MKETEQVFKLQRPLSMSPGMSPLCMAYNRERTESHFVPYDDDMKAFFQQHRNPPKLYVLAQMTEGTLVISGVVSNPDDW